MIIGLTGRSGSGKSTASCIFKEHGAYIINADKIGHDILHGEAHDEVLQEFGACILNEIGGIDRKKLAEVVFNDEGALKRLNEITHPKITIEIKRLIAGKELVCIDAALLYEADIDSLCDVVISFHADTETLISRIAKRDGISASLARKRINAIMEKRGDIVILNDCEYDEFSKKIIEIIKRLVQQ